MSTQTEQHDDNDDTSSTDSVVLSIDGKSLSKRIEQAKLTFELRGTGGKLGSWWCSQFWELVADITDGIDHKPSSATTASPAEVGAA